jgi:hypothetical protein
MLRTLVISDSTESSPDFDTEPWNDVALVTPRHAVRKLWNESALRKHCQVTSHQLFICTAEDNIKGKALSLQERYGVAMCNAGSKRRKKCEDLPDTIKIAIGMKVMVTQNVKTDLDITNGARGTITGLVLHPDEPPISNEAIVTLKHLPAFIFIKLNRTRATQLQGLPDSVIPVETITKTFQIKVKTPKGKDVNRTVCRRQFPITASYAFTDYRSQGQTISHVLIDIATPPSGELNLFNLYVALSRSSGWSTIRLLHDFDDELFKKCHSLELLAEDDRLMELDQKTDKWWKKMTKDNKTVVVEHT